MTGIPIPARAIGRVGMVAQLQRLRTNHGGKLVAVRAPVGLMSSLADRPVFAWQVLVLGEPIELNGKACREIIVADRCLKPVSQLNPGEVDALARSQAEHDVDEAMADIRHILDAHHLSTNELEAFVDKAAEQIGIERLLEVVPVPVALKELDFRPAGSGDEVCLQWSGMHLGSELHVFAGPDMFARWMLVGRNLSRRQAMLDERSLHEREPRGRVALQVLDLWREAFGRGAPVPDVLTPALDYEHHLNDLKSAHIGLPTLSVDGEVFRATRRWIAQRVGPGRTNESDQGPDVPLHLSFGCGLLRLEAPGLIFACPASGVWVGDCAVSTRHFLALPNARLRGWRTEFQRSADVLAINGMDLEISRETGSPSAGLQDHPR